MIRIALAVATVLAFATPALADGGLIPPRPNTAQLNGQTWNGAAVSGGIVSPTLVDIELPRR